MVYELVKNLDNDRYEPYVICYGKKLNTYLEDSMEKVCHVSYLGEERHIGIFAVLQVMKALNSIKPNLVHSHMGGITFAMPWSILYHRPLVVTIHTKPDKAFSKKNEFFLRLRLKIGRIKVVAVSQENKHTVQKYFNLNEHKCTYVNNGIDLSKYTQIPHEGFRFINVARQDENKNQKAIIRCFERIHNIYSNSKLLLVGDGPCHNQLITLVNELRIASSVEFPGMVDNPQDYYAVSDVYVQSSHREAMPLSVLEAMASGLPLVSTDVGGLKDVVNENGILVRDNDEQELYQAMLTMIEMPDWNIKMKQAASKKAAENYSSGKMAEEYMAIYDELRG
jgi:glycosyltransferase involved in cell wall biosynthesis